jgi:hypothetical protein
LLDGFDEIGAGEDRERMVLAARELLTSLGPQAAAVVLATTRPQGYAGELKRIGVPLQVESRWVHPARAPQYLKQDFGQVTPTAYLLQVAPLVGFPREKRKPF